MARAVGDMNCFTDSTIGIEAWVLKRDFSATMTNRSLREMRSRKNGSGLLAETSMRPGVSQIMTSGATPSGNGTNLPTCETHIAKDP